MKKLLALTALFLVGCNEESPSTQLVADNVKAIAKLRSDLDAEIKGRKKFDNFLNMYQSKMMGKKDWRTDYAFPEVEK